MGNQFSCHSCRKGQHRRHADSLHEDLDGKENGIGLKEDARALTSTKTRRRKHAALGLQVGCAAALGPIGAPVVMTAVLVGSNVLQAALRTKIDGMSRDTASLLMISSMCSYAGVRTLTGHIPAQALGVAVGTVALLGPLEIIMDQAYPRLCVYAARAVALEDMPTWQQQKLVLATIVNWTLADWPQWALFYGLRFSTSAVMNLFPLTTATAASNILSTEDQQDFGILIPIVGMLLGRYALETGSRILLQETRTRFVNRVKSQLQEKTLQQEMAFFEATAPPWLMQQINASNSVADIPAVLFPRAITSMMSIAAAFSVLSRFDVALAAMCVVSVPLNLVLSYAYSQYVQRMNVQKMRSRSRMSECVNELVHNAKVCKLFSAVEQKMDDYWKETDEMVALVRSNVRVTAFASVLDSVMPNILSMLMFTYTASLVRAGKMNLTDMMMVGMYQQNLTGAFNAIPSVITQYGAVMGENRKVFQMLNRVPKSVPRGDYTVDRLKGYIELRDVSFRYRMRKRHNFKEDSAAETLARRERVRLLKLQRRAENVDGHFDDPLEDLHEYDPVYIEVDVLQGFSLSIRPGEKVALVGRSGSGKTTVANLILGMYDPCEGEVLIDGVPVHKYKPEWLYTEGVGVVSQNPSLLDLTFKENLTLGIQHKKCSDEAMEEACKKAAAHDFIMQAEKKYETTVGRNGGKLSGGQRQRIAIARVLLRDPSILVLDEATSALDAEAEHLVQDAIHKAMEGRTVLMIAHRLSTIKNADRILVMDAGKIVEEGTHTELLAKNGLYANLVQKQLIEMGEQS